MLKKKERLSTKEFNRFFSLGARSHSPTLQLVYHPFDSFHASVVVPKKIARTAVLRNKIRRRIYDILRTNTNKPTGVFIILVKPPIITKSFTELKQEVNTLIGGTTKAR